MPAIIARLTAGGDGDEGGGDVDCSGFGETWGPGIGPPPPGCEGGGGGGGQGGQLSDVSLVSAPVFSPLALMWMLVLALLLMRRLQWNLAAMEC